jgi:ABC-type protease/lipase transport system fused ATPase/permease subunit
VAIVAHRMSVLSVSDKILVLRDGRVEAFGPRDEVVARLQAHPQIRAHADRLEAVDA